MTIRLFSLGFLAWVNISSPCLEKGDCGYSLSLGNESKGTEQMRACVLMEKPWKELARFRVIIALHSLSWKIFVYIFWLTQGGKIQVLNQRKASKEMKRVCARAHFLVQATYNSSEVTAYIY